MWNKSEFDEIPKGFFLLPSLLFHPIYMWIAKRTFFNRHQTQNMCIYKRYSSSGLDMNNNTIIIINNSNNIGLVGGLKRRENTERKRELIKSTAWCRIILLSFIIDTTNCITNKATLKTTTTTTTTIRLQKKIYLFFMNPSIAMRVEKKAMKWNQQASLNNFVHFSTNIISSMKSTDKKKIIKIQVSCELLLW